MNQERLNRNQHPIAKRIIVRGILILDTPTCLGSGDADSPTDLALLRDSVSDCALLTGASITGALRNYLRECEHGYGAGEQNCDRATTLFGGTRRDPDGEKSPLIINDAISSKIPVIELRDGVAIESITGTAKKGQKYDLELLAAETEFQLGFELSVEKNLSQSKQQALINLLALALRGLEQGDISIGMKKRRGFGRCHVKNWQVWNFHLENHDDRMAWLNFEHWRTGLLPDRETYSSIATALGVSLENEKDERDRFLIHATFNLVGSLLIRSGQDSTGRAPDVVHLKSHLPDKSDSLPVLSGTSLAGVLRHRAERIVNTLGGSSTLVKELFGFVEGKEAKSSSLVVHEKVIENATELVQNRIAIDRFTGGAYHGALFDEQPIFGGSVCIELELRNPQDHQIGLLLLLLKDLWTSDLPVGGESSIGRGRLKGIKADLIWNRPQHPKQWKITQSNGNLQIEDGLDLSKSETLVKDDLEQFVKALLKELGKEV
ncbi:MULTISPECIES: RAMP superfamily CRISPR-associated protein [unclassified Microcoleus]|uniref:RAMP superfamily CRISPR-associated protein n=1 Tax=unclassified Microcoleus TaxID=2642155 RepID=UPI0025FC21A3|nr:MULTISPECIES: RAMP superfamily CRISPR-associated protein [unclassified Microcoleus]